MLEAAAHQPEAGLPGRAPHRTHFALGIQSPCRADTIGNGIAKDEPHRLRHILVAGRNHDRVELRCRAVVEMHGLAIEVGHRTVLHPDLAVDDQLRTARVDIVAAAGAVVLHQEAAAVLAEVHREARFGQPVQQILVHLGDALRELLVELGEQRERKRVGDEVRIFHRRAVLGED